jgi:hypothetical protein
LGSSNLDHELATEIDKLKLGRVIDGAVDDYQEVVEITFRTCAFEAPINLIRVILPIVACSRSG